MKPKRIILLRHGESEGNTDRTIYASKPDHAIALTPCGCTQAARIGESLGDLLQSETLRVYLSPYTRVKQTYAEVDRHLKCSSIEIIEDPRIRDLDWGCFNDEATRLRVETEKEEYGKFYFRVPNGESAADAFNRVSDFMGTLHRGFSKEIYPENCLVVTHSIIMRLFAMRWFHASVETYDKMNRPGYCAVALLQKQNDQTYRWSADVMNAYHP
jgi:broad specificity phosphatase PhoE